MVAMGAVGGFLSLMPTSPCPLFLLTRLSLWNTRLSLVFLSVLVYCPIFHSTMKSLTQNVRMRRLIILTRIMTP